MENKSRRKSHHMTYDDRLKIEALSRQKLSQTVIADTLGFSQQTISKELRRGMVEQLDGATWLTYKTYSAEKAQQDADYQKTAKGAPLKIGNHHDLSKYIEQKIIKERYSPYAISHEINDNPKVKVKLSASTIYNYVNRGVFCM